MVIQVFQQVNVKPSVLRHCVVWVAQWRQRLFKPDFLAFVHPHLLPHQRPGSRKNLLRKGISILLAHPEKHICTEQETAIILATLSLYSEQKCWQVFNERDPFKSNAI